MVDQAEIHRKSMSNIEYERAEALRQIGINFAELPDKEQAGADLHRFTQDDDRDVQYTAAWSLGVAFPHIPDKEQAQADLHRFTQDDDLSVQVSAAWSLGVAFPHIPDKEQAWIDLIRLTQDEDRLVQHYAGVFLGSAFLHVPDKNQAWVDLHQLTLDENSYVRGYAAASLSSAFPHVPDKEQFWADLHRLTQDEDSFVRISAVWSVWISFPHVPNKKLAWADLIRLTQDENSTVRLNAAVALYSCFPHVPDKKQVWADLIRLAQDKDRYVRVHANHSLGRASIFRATEAEREEEFGNELEKALEFFEKTSTEAGFINPAKFCLPFYRSFYTLTFKEQEAKAEVQRYLAEAKIATDGSENKEQLLEAIENLADALKEVQNARETDFGIMKRDLNVYRRYCDRAADLLKTTEEKAPGATKLIRKGLPIFNQRIKELLDGIDKETTILCDAVRGTEAEEFVKPTCKGVRELIKIRNPIELDKRIAGLIPNLRFMVENLPERERNFGYDKIETLDKEDYLEDKLSLLNEIIVFVAPHISMSKDLERLENKLDDIMISLEPRISEALTVAVGAKVFGTGIEHKITIPLQEIAYSDLEKDLESIKGIRILKLASLPPKLAEKLKGYLIRNKKDDIL